MSPSEFNKLVTSVRADFIEPNSICDIDAYMQGAKAGGCHIGDVDALAAALVSEFATDLADPTINNSADDGHDATLDVAAYAKAESVPLLRNLTQLRVRGVLVVEGDSLPSVSCLATLLGVAFDRSMYGRATGLETPSQMWAHPGDRPMKIRSSAGIPFRFRMIRGHSTPGKLVNDLVLAFKGILEQDVAQCTVKGDNFSYNSSSSSSCSSTPCHAWPNTHM